MEESRGIQIEKLGNGMLTVVTATVMDTLTVDELYLAVLQLREKMKTPDPKNPNLWSTEINGYKLWGILDEGAGPNGERTFTILFPSDY
jgi:hypothetical protein